MTPTELRDHPTGIHEPTQPQPFGEPTRSSALIDRDDLLARVAGDSSLLQELIALFRETWPPLMAELRAAVGEHDAGKVHVSAHTLKGCASTFAAAAVVTAAFKLESMGKSRQLTGAVQALAELESLMQRLEMALNELVRELVAN